MMTEFYFLGLTVPLRINYANMVFFTTLNGFLNEQLMSQNVLIFLTVLLIIFRFYSPPTASLQTE